MVIEKDKVNKRASKKPVTSEDTGSSGDGIHGSGKYELGLDISTSIIGVCILDDQGNLKALDAIKLGSTKLTNLWEKADEGIKQIEEIVARAGLVKSDIRRVFVESAMQRFSVGYSSAAVIITLAKFNGLVSYLCYKSFGFPVVEVNVNTARKNIGYINKKTDKRPVKDKVFELVVAKKPSFPWQKHIATAGKSKGKEVFDTGMKDACDAFVIVYGGAGVRTL